MEELVRMLFVNVILVLKNSQMNALKIQPQLINKVRFCLALYAPANNVSVIVYHLNLLWIIETFSRKMGVHG